MAAARVIVTRPEKEAAHWIAQLQARGVTAAALPLITITPCQDQHAQTALSQAWAKLASYRAVMFVSANAAAYFFEANSAFGPVGRAGAAPKLRAWAPGPGTVKALVAAGLAPECIDSPPPESAQFDSEALWHKVHTQIHLGDRVLIVRGMSTNAKPQTRPATQGTGRDWLAQQIEAAGGQVDFVAVYQRSAPHFTAAQRSLAQQAAGDGSVWLFSSSEALAHLLQALPGQNWGAARALATHPRIAAAARAAGFAYAQECRPALEDVVASIESAA